MEEISWEAKVGHGLQDERDEGHALGLGRYAEQSHFGGRTGHVALNRVGPRVCSALMPDLVSTQSLLCITRMGKHSRYIYHTLSASDSSIQRKPLHIFSPPHRPLREWQAQQQQLQSARDPLPDATRLIRVLFCLRVTTHRPKENLNHPRQSLVL